MRLLKKDTGALKKPGAFTATWNPAITWIRNLPWDKLPKFPGFRKLFGPALLLSTIGLLVGYFFLLDALRPETVGKRIPLSEVFRAARDCRVESGVLKDLDSVVLLKVYDAPPAAAAALPATGENTAAMGTDEIVVCPKPAKEILSEKLIAIEQAKIQAAQPPPPPPAKGSKASPPPPPPPPIPEIELPSPKQYWASYPGSDAETTVILSELFNGHATADIDPQTGKKALKFIAQFLFPLLILATVFSLFFMVITGQGGGAAEFLGFSKFAARIQRRRRGKGAVTFEDVAAIDEGITELQEVVDYLTNPAKFAELGARAPKGVLLVGPPGTGKTLLARAVAGEANVPFMQLIGSEFVESLVGVGAARVRDMFRQARALAPCIVFIDELDAAGRQRGAGVGQGNDEREQTLNQLLAEMDGFSATLGVCIVAATNRPDILDPALLRPGRFDRQIVIDVPDVRGRFEILKVHARGRPMAPDCDLMSIAKQTPGFTGADLANILNEAALLAVRRKAGEVIHRDLEEAVDRVVAGPERRSHILTDEEKTLIAYHEAGHAVTARGAGQETGVLKLSIIARGLSLGHSSTYVSADRLIMLRSELEGQITALLGGLAAEKLMLGELSTGNARDLEQATTLARKLVATYGMTEALGRMQVLHEGAVFMGRDFAAVQHTSQQTLDRVDDEINKVLLECERRAIEICKANKPVMDELVKALLERETMTGPELEPYLAKVKRLALPKALSALAAAAAGNGPAAPRRRRRASTPAPGTQAVE